MPCPSCGTVAPAAARFCPECGQVLQLRADERRVVTVLFGDLVGFTSLSEALDPERVKNLVDELFDRLAADIVRFGGRVDKVMGDGIVALFGAPISHGDDAERAVRAALKMQDTVRSFAREADLPMRMRIGVNTGEALVGSLRADTDYTATGDTVNTASRLQVAAEPGSVLVGEGTYGVTTDAIRYVEMPPVLAKGKEDPVRAWRAVGAVGRPGERRTHLVSPLVGRDDEVLLMRSALDMAMHRRRAQLLVVMGDAGLGKTRLAEEVVAIAREQHGALVFAGRCVPYGEANPWQPIAEAISGVLALSPEATLADARASVAAQVSELFRASSSSPDVERSVAGLLHLLGFETTVGHLEPQSQSLETGRAVRTFLQAQATRRMVVLWLSDLHWADDVVLRLVDALCHRLARLRFVLVTTARYSLNERWSPKAGRHNTMVVSLDPLDQDAAAQMVDELSMSSIGGPLRDEIIDRAGGNPFVLQELVALVGDGSRTTLSTGELPSSVRGLVEARLDTLTDVERGVLEDASVVGRGGSIKALVRMVSGTRPDVDSLETLRTLRDKDLLNVDREEWSFRSELVRDVAYGRLTKTDRARRHAGIAEYLVQHGEGPRVVDAAAFHFRRAAENAQELGRIPGLPADIDALAILWLRRAAKGKPADAAIRLLGQALSLTGNDHPERAPILLERAGRYAAHHQLATARRDVLEARACALDREVIEAHVLLRLGDIEHRGGDFDRAIALYSDATTRFRRLGELAGAAEALRLSGITYLFTGRFEAAESAILAALQSFEDLADVQSVAWSWQNLAWISLARGRLQQAESRVDRALGFFEGVSDESGASWCRGLLAYVRFHQGRLDEADALSAAAFTEARERGERWGEGMMLALRASVHLWSGRTSHAVRRAEESLEFFRDLGDVFSESQALAVYARSLALVGRLDDATRVLDDAQRRTGESRSANMSLLVSTAASAIAVDIGDPEGALARLGTFDTAGLHPAIIGQGDRIVAIGVTLAQLGRFAEAREVLERGAANVTDAGRDPNALASLALVMVAQGELDAARDMVGTVESSTRATYVDHIFAAISEAFIAHRRGHDDERADCLVRARAIVARTEDRVHDAFVALAAGVLEPATRPSADHRLRQLGIDAHGWVALFQAMRG